MYCSNCGNQLADGARFCSSCGAPVSGQPAPTEQAGDEIIIMQGLCNRVKSPLLVQNGNAMLTNKRFIYLKHSLAKIFVIGAAVNLTKGSYDFDIPISNIESIEDGRQGISKTIIINTKNGEKYNFYVTNREEWKIKLQNVIDNS